MIEIKTEQSVEAVKKLCADCGLEYTADTYAAVMRDKDETLGFSVFDMRRSFAVVRALSPVSDIPLADGMLRSTIHIALSGGCTAVFYDDTAPEELFMRLGFVKNKEIKELDSAKLFESCKSCK